MEMMHTTAIRATRRAYSTSDAPRSVLQRAWSQALTNSYEVSIPGSPCAGADGRPTVMGPDWTCRGGVDPGPKPLDGSFGPFAEKSSVEVHDPHARGLQHGLGAVAR